MTPFARRIVADASATIAAAGANTAYARANIRATTKKYASERAVALIHQLVGVLQRREDDRSGAELKEFTFRFSLGHWVRRRAPQFARAKR
jgi:hypothetical protein